MKFLTLLAAFALVALAAAQPATKRAQLLRIHQVTREEYDALLKLAKGKSTLSEARLIHSPLTGIKALAVKGIGLFAAGSHLNKNGYNLCTSEKRSLYFTEKVDEDDSDEHEHGGHKWGHETSNDDDDTIDCITVVKDPEHEDDDDEDDDHHHHHGHTHYPYNPYHPYTYNNYNPYNNWYNKYPYGGGYGGSHGGHYGGGYGSYYGPLAQGPFPNAGYPTPPFE